MTVFADTFDKATPAGSDDPSEADDRMREIKAAIQERENVDHYWPLTGTEVSDVDAGEHRKVTLRVGSAPTAVADKGFVYAKDVAGKAELFYRDEDGNEIQLTSGGKLGAATINLTVNNATVAGTLGVTGVATLGDGSLLAAATESGDADLIVSDKLYVENNGHPPINGSQTAVKTKYFTGNLDADSSTSVAHGVTSTNILSVTVSCFDDDLNQFSVGGYRDSADANRSFRVNYDTTNIIIAAVGANVQGNAYRIKIDHTE